MKRFIIATTLLMILVTSVCIVPLKVYALAMSGTFNGQVFDIMQGSSLNKSDVYALFFNNDDVSREVVVTSQCPAGVNLILSETSFEMAPQSQKQINVDIEVTLDAVPGEYEISITAECTEGGLSGTVRGTAELIVRGLDGTYPQSSTPTSTPTATSNPTPTLEPTPTPTPTTLPTPTPTPTPVPIPEPTNQTQNSDSMLYIIIASVSGLALGLIIALIIIIRR